MPELKIGLCQMRVIDDKNANLATARKMIARAATEGADFVLLPEMFNCPYNNSCFARYAEPAGGETCQMLSEEAARHGVILIGGSIPERDGESLYNTSFIYGPKGEPLGFHRKVHLFDADVPGGIRFMESETLSPGGTFTVLDTPRARIGVAVCFDIRFSAFFARMADMGADIIFVPAAFNMTTGPVHWELSFRMRATDNQCFIAGCSPARDETASYVAYGNSLVCDPWGRVLGRLNGEEDVLITTIDLEEAKRVREALPIRRARRTDLY